MSTRQRKRPWNADAGSAAVQSVAQAAVDAARAITDSPNPDPAVIIALCATVLDRLLEVFMEMDQEKGRVVHAAVLRGLSTPGRNKPAVQ